MGLFDRFRNRHQGSVPQQSDQTDLQRDKLIRCFDQSGQEILIPKEEWRLRVLPGTIKTAWEDSEKLYNLLAMALQDGFAADVLDAARHLSEVEPKSTRATCVFAIALLQTDRLDEAEAVLQKHLTNNGEDGYVLTNLAKVYAARNQHEKAEATLWHALEVDPNQDNALTWYVATQRERFGSDAGIEALRRVVAIDGAWRPQLWLARAALEDHHLEQAVALYHQCLARAGEPVPADVIMQISGDLGNHGWFQDLIDLTEPIFRPEVHGLPTGNNLIKANLALGRRNAAIVILNQLNSFKRPDWRQTLDYWETQIAEAPHDQDNHHSEAN